MESFLFEIALVVSLIALPVLAILLARKRRRDFLRKSLSQKLLLVRLPRQEKESPSFKEELNLTQQLWSILSGISETIVCEAAVPYVGEEILFYVSVPESLVSSISRHVEGIFKNAHIEIAPEYNLFQPNGENGGFFLSQVQHYALPLRTYAESESDTFSPILNALSQLKEMGEGAALQVLMRPASSMRKKEILSFLEKIKKGEPFEKVFSAKDLFTSSVKKEEEKSSRDEERIRFLEQKISKPLLEVNIRIVASSQSAQQTNYILDAFQNAFTQFSAPLKNSLKAVRVKNFQKFSFPFIFRQFDDSQTMVLNTEELAGLFHFPSPSTLSPNIKWLKSKELPPPTELPREGTFIGENVFRGARKPILLTEEDRRRHVYIVGQTGTGKSALMVNMALDDIRKGKGVALIDPHGDIHERMLGLIPRERMSDVVVFDPGEIQKPMGLNMLEYDRNRPEEKTFIVNEVQGIFNRLFLAETMGPMFEQYMRNALLLLMESFSEEPATFMEVPRVFTDDDFRKKCLEKISNPVVLDFWTKEVSKVGGEASLSNMSPYITSKFNNFIANDYLRPIIGQSHSSIQFRKIIDEGKILLVNLSKGKIGDINASLLGMIITGKLLMAAFSRASIPENQRRDFYLYIDEFQNFTTDSVSVILSEARKYRLNLTVAHQFIAQLKEDIRDAVFGNVGSIIAFRVGSQDASFLKKQFEPACEESDLINIENLRAYAKILVNGRISAPFSVNTPLYSPSDLQLAQDVKEQSLKTYGRKQEEVEREILGRLRI